MDTLEAILRTKMETLQYVAFFGAIGLFGLLETIIARAKSPTKRKTRWPTNVALTVLNIIVLGAMPVSGVLAADYAQTNNLGLLNIFHIAPIAAFVIGFAFRSFVSWGTHLAMHKIPLLWQVHRVHHTDTQLDISTTVRFHPLEFLINTPILLLAVVAMGISPVTLMIYELFDAAMAVFTHANIRLPRPVERLLVWLVVTPDMHRVHHSSHQPETDSNYGATLSIWDHLFRTYRHKQPVQLADMKLGLAECQDRRATSLLWLLTLPFRSRKIPAEPIQPGHQPTPSSEAQS